MLKKVAEVFSKLLDEKPNKNASSYDRYRHLMYE